MPRAILVTAHLVGPTTVELDEPVADPTSQVEVVIRPPSASARVPDAAEFWVERSVEQLAAEQGVVLPQRIEDPGATTLFHEWGHHVDRLWSRGDTDVLFSLRWFSRFYDVRLHREARARRGASEPIATQLDAAAAAPALLMRTSELFATLFEDWMRGEKNLSVDYCASDNVDFVSSTFDPAVGLELLSGVNADEVRAQTYELFERGQGGLDHLPDVRGDLFGMHTAATLSAIRVAMERLRAESGGAI